MSASPSMQLRERAARLEVVEALRQELRQRGAGSTLVETEGAVEAGTESTEKSSENLEGIESLEKLLSVSSGRGSLGVISGDWSSGKTSLALTQVARVTRSGQRAAVVDSRGWLFPPALALMEGDLKKILLLQPPAKRAVWSTEQVLRSGLFSLAVLLEPRKLDRAGLRRLQLAAERGRTLCLLIPRDPASAPPGLISLRLHVRSIPAETSPQQALIAAPPRQQQLRILHQRRAMPDHDEGGAAPLRSRWSLSPVSALQDEEVQSTNADADETLDHPRALPA